MSLHAPVASSSTNSIGIAAMLASMAAFASNDTCIKLIGHALPLGELIFLRSVMATLYLLAFALLFGGLAVPAVVPWRLLRWRVGTEFLATLTFVSGLMALPIADATALMQLTPLAITAAAGIFLGERIGWRRWTATAVGLCGVLLIARPGTAAFSPAALLILAAVVFVSARDLLARAISSVVPSLTLATLSTVTGICTGLILLPFETWIWPETQVLLLVVLASGFLAAAFALSVVAMRHGDVGLVSPFRYAVMLFALISGWIFWRQWPDAMQLFGIVILTGAGLYTFRRERALRRIV